VTVVVGVGSAVMPFTTLLVAAVLVAITVALHAVGLAVVLASLVRSHAALPTAAWPIIWLLVRLTWVLILIHIAGLPLLPFFAISAKISRLHSPRQCDRGCLPS
jgi:hypothetical protein